MILSTVPGTAYILPMAERSVLELGIYLPLQVQWCNLCVLGVLKLSGTIQCGPNWSIFSHGTWDTAGKKNEVCQPLLSLPIPTLVAATSSKVGSRGNILNPGWYQSSYVTPIWKLTTLITRSGGCGEDKAIREPHSYLEMAS